MVVVVVVVVVIILNMIAIITTNVVSALNLITIMVVIMITSTDVFLCFDYMLMFIVVVVISVLFLGWVDGWTGGILISTHRTEHWLHILVQSRCEMVRHISRSRQGGCRQTRLRQRAGRSVHDGTVGLSYL